MIQEGRNLVRVIRVVKAPYLIYMVFTFTLQDVGGDQHLLQYKVPLGSEPAALIRDLAVLSVSREWVQMQLKQKEGYLAVSSICQPNINQQDITDIAYAGRAN